MEIYQRTNQKSGHVCWSFLALPMQDHVAYAAHFLEQVVKRPGYVAWWSIVDGGLLFSFSTESFAHQAQKLYQQEIK